MKLPDEQNPTYIIRRANADDLSFIRSLSERFAHVGTPAWREPAKMWQFHQRFGEEVSMAIDDPASLVLLAQERGGMRLGFIYALSLPDFFTNELQGYIADVAVSAEAEGKGIGRRLMEQAEVWTKEQGYRLLALDVFAFNTHARSLYQRLGYVEETLKLVKDLSINKKE